jgi:large subunit ribosomal protein L11
MAKETIDIMVAGGKATAAPPLGPALGPMGVNIKSVVDEINRKTGSFNGMQVPVKVVIDTEHKTFEVSVGTPPASALIKKECNVEKGASNAKLEKVADLRIEQIIKIAKMKEDNLQGKTLKERVKEIAGSCQSIGILIEGKPAHTTIEDINSGIYDAKIASGKTELTAEELKKLDEEKKRLHEEFLQMQAQFEAKAQAVAKEMEGKTSKEIRNKLADMGIPIAIIDKVVPKEAKSAPAAAPGAAAAAPPKK